MRPAHKLDPYLERAVEEHEELHQVVIELRTLLESKSAEAVDASTLSQAIRLLSDLHDKLQQHFTQEEQGGYLEEALTRVPRLAPQADMLQKQHGEFCTESRQLLNDAQNISRLPEAWLRLQAAFHLFAKRLLAHEAAEDSLLQQAFNEDLGTDTK